MTLEQRADQAIEASYRELGKWEREKRDYPWLFVSITTERAVRRVIEGVRVNDGLIRRVSS